MRGASAIFLPLLTFVAVTGAAELVVRAGWVADYILPAPTQVFRALMEPGTDLWPGLWETAKAALAGLGLSILIGGTLAVLLSSSRVARRALYPYAVFFQTVPIIAIAPMLVIWTKTQFQTVAVAACIASVFPVIANSFAGLSSTEPALRDLFRLYGGSWWQTLWKLRLPWALPNILTGLRVAAGLAVIGAMVGEFVGGGGLGSVIETAKPQLRNDKIFAAVLLASLMGLVLFVAIQLLSMLALRHWHASERDA